MTPALEVIAPGAYTTVQDHGRAGFQDIGIPVSGPLDRIAFRLANALAGNAPGTAALEILLQGPTLKVAAESVRVVLVGGSAAIEVRSPQPRRIPAGQSVRLLKDEVFRVGALGDTVCAYLAFEGGLDIPHVLGSASTCVRGSLGGIEGRRLQPRDRVPLALRGAEARTESALARPVDLALGQTIRVVLGPQADYFTDDAVRTLLSAEYKVSPQADRMGYRLEGATLEHTRGYDLLSDGIVAGAVQVPGTGLPIVLMVDHQSTGGYPKIATVISADIPVVGRRKPGRPIRFTAVEVREAERLRRAQEAAVAKEIADIRPIE